MNRTSLRYLLMPTTALLICLVSTNSHAQRSPSDYSLRLSATTFSIAPRISLVSQFPGVSKTDIQTLSNAPKQRLVAVRLGVGVNGDPGIALGLDLTPPHWNLAPNLATRFTVEAISPSRSIGFLDSISPAGVLTVDQVYQPLQVKGARPYIGVGVGLYSGHFGAQTPGSEFQWFGPTYNSVTVFGGKLFVGADFTSTTGLELSVHRASDQTLFAAQLRLKL